MNTPHLSSVSLQTNADRPLYARLIGLSWLHFLNDGAANYLPGVLPAILISLRLHIGLAGTVMAALLIGQALQALTGWIADHLGGRLFIVIGLLGSTLAGGMIGFAPNMRILIPILVLVGIANAFFHPQALSGARTLSRNRQAFGLSLFLIGGEIGRGLWPLFASLVVTHWGLHYLWVLTIPAIASLPFVWNALPSQPARHPNATPIMWRQHFGPLASLVGFSSLRALILFGVVTYLPILWHSQGHSLVESSAVISVLLVVGVIGNVAGGQIADLFGRKRVAFTTSLAATILLILFIHVNGPIQWLLLGLLGIALFATLPVSIVIGQDIFPENRSMGSGIALGVSNGLGAIGLILLGLIANRLGLMDVLWMLVGTGILASLASLALPITGNRARD